MYKFLPFQDNQNESSDEEDHFPYPIPRESFDMIHAHDKKTTRFNVAKRDFDSDETASIH